MAERSGIASWVRRQVGDEVFAQALENELSSPAGPDQPTTSAVSITAWQRLLCDFPHRNNSGPRWPNLFRKGALKYLGLAIFRRTELSVNTTAIERQADVSEASQTSRGQLVLRSHV